MDTAAAATCAPRGGWSQHPSGWTSPICMGVCGGGMWVSISGLLWVAARAARPRSRHAGSE